MIAKVVVNGYEFQFDDADVVNPEAFRDTGNQAWLLHDHGFCLAVIFAADESEALDEVADSGQLDRLKLSEDEVLEALKDETELDSLGNAGEYFDIENLGVVRLPEIPFSFAALTIAAANDLAYEAWSVDSKKTARLERDLRFRNQMIEAAQQGIRQGNLARAQTCLDRALNYKWEEAPVTSAVEARYERAWKEAEFHAACLNEPVRVEIKGEGEETP